MIKDYGKYIQDQMGKALHALPPKEQAEMNRFIQNVGGVMGDSTKTQEQKTAAVLLIQTEMQEKYADSSNK